MVCNFISTATTLKTNACQKIYEIQSDPSNHDSKNFFYVLKCKVCGEIPYVQKAKTIFFIGLIIKRANTERLERAIGKFLKNYFTFTNASMATAVLKIRIL